MKKILSPIALAAILAFAACNSNNANNQQAHNHDEHAGHDHSNHDHDHSHHDHEHSKEFQNEHNSKNAIDWSGEYKGILPCADCPGIETTIKLYPDETFAYKAIYQDRNLTVADTGKFMWHDHGNTVHLKSKETDIKYKVGENKVIQLDANGKTITGTLADNYILNKVQ